MKRISGPSQLSSDVYDEWFMQFVKQGYDILTPSAALQTDRISIFHDLSFLLEKTMTFIIE